MIGIGCATDIADTGCINDGTVIIESAKGKGELEGVQGVVKGGLRPTGKIRLDDGRLLDVVTDGMFIDDSARVRINRLDGNRIIVRAVEPEEDTEVT